MVQLHPAPCILAKNYLLKLASSYQVFASARYREDSGRTMRLSSTLENQKFLSVSKIWPRRIKADLGLEFCAVNNGSAIWDCLIKLSQGK